MLLFVVDPVYRSRSRHKYYTVRAAPLICVLSEHFLLIIHKSADLLRVNSS